MGVLNGVRQPNCLSGLLMAKFWERLGISRPIPNAIKDLPVPFQAFAQIVEYARANLKRRVSVVELAKFSNMSVSTLGRRFHQHLRLSPSEFLSQLRISHACQMLEHSPFNISADGFECGFENAARLFSSLSNCKCVSRRQSTASGSPKLFSGSRR